MQDCFQKVALNMFNMYFLGLKMDKTDYLLGDLTKMGKENNVRKQHIVPAKVHFLKYSPRSKKKNVSQDIRWCL